MEKINTHLKINKELNGTPIEITEKSSKVELTVIDLMKVDEKGLIHGGFIFGMADYAAMIAVNHPNVVLGGANVKFIKPTKEGDHLIAEAILRNDERIIMKNGVEKIIVDVVIKREDLIVFEGEFTCFILKKHVLD